MKKTKTRTVVLYIAIAIGIIGTIVTLVLYIAIAIGMIGTIVTLTIDLDPQKVAIAVLFAIALIGALLVF